MAARVLGFAGTRPVWVLARVRSDGHGLSVRGLPPPRGRSTAHRVDAAIRAAGLPVPAGHVEVSVLPVVMDGATWMLDLPIALAVIGMRVDPCRAPAAAAGLALDGRVVPVGGAGWVGSAELCADPMRPTVVALRRVTTLVEAHTVAASVVRRRPTSP